ncbi:MAG: TM2 domain-containing protein [Duncaniella sp.]|nr:TM2 domain-containing protein [Duncaniella sp.]MDE6582603.1 TM2 domain-containing protein [Duncaniella sp.]
MAYPYDNNYSNPTPPPFGEGNNFENEYLMRNNPFDSDPRSGKSRGVAALLAIFLGGLGVQYFYLGKTTAGLLTILITVCTCGAWELLTLIQGILMLCMDNRSFLQKYVYTTSSFPLF